MCVLLLGYKEQMEAMMRTANPGLARRFQLAAAWTFEDYGPEDLLAITRAAARKRCGICVRARIVFLCACACACCAKWPVRRYLAL